MRKFHFVDFAAKFQKGFRNHVVPVEDVPALREAYKRYACSCTYFFYSDEILSYVSAAAESERPSVAGYAGKVWAPYFPLDLDHANLETALEAARFLARFFLETWRVDPAGLALYFSGLKGFHLMLDTRLFGKLAPSRGIPLFFAAMRRHMAEMLPLPLKETVDLSVKDRLRLLRLPNTVHEESGLWKIPLSAEELASLGPEAIRALARSARPLELTDETGLIARRPVAENAAAAKFFRRVSGQVRRLTRKPFVYRFRRPEDLSQIRFPCLGVQEIWEGRVLPGYRNNCAIRLASEFRLLGLSAEETREKMLDWNERNGVRLPEEEIESVVRSAYQPVFPYRYGCRDEILRHFCFNRSFEECQAYTTKPQSRARPAR